MILFLTTSRSSSRVSARISLTPMLRVPLIAKSRSSNKPAPARVIRRGTVSSSCTFPGLNPPQISQFYDGLKEHVKDMLINVSDAPTNFDKYVKLCISLDDRHHRRDAERKTKSSNVKNSNHNNNSNWRLPNGANAGSSPTAALPLGEPMQIDATKTRRGPLTQEERDDRRAKGLCAYCGGKHAISVCPNMNDSAKKRYALQKASPSGKA
ncbi:hypothetical protein PLICRDRAFT_338308 [Plicaturopsis crispa FD-325 SS-3]|uniref:Uncharacterized protein n=1 Tax=Plicaturopsis crispa FD-325 SS-3 TaxID=944288 RepID=A0A0C9SS47_PLICR|nr:hypothetical protein PLICRDRAFT_338308 [Plicaturopsis crispa FD-325 SS-3]